MAYQAFAVYVRAENTFWIAGFFLSFSVGATQVMGGGEDVDLYHF